MEIENLFETAPQGIGQTANMYLRDGAGAAERRTKSIADGYADDCLCRDTKTYAEHT